MILLICSNMKQISSSCEGKLLRYFAFKQDFAGQSVLHGLSVSLYFIVVKPEHSEKHMDT